MRAHRQLVGTVFNLIVRTLGVWHVTDTQCGFKLLRGEVAAELFREVRTDGFGFDVELLLLAQRRGYRIVEVPINWVDQPGSRVSVIKEGPRMLAQVLAARLRLGFGRGPAEGAVIARRAREIEPFLAVEVFQRAQALEREGADVIHLEFGEPDFDTPAVIREAAEKALKDGRTRYAHPLGILPLREAIAEHYHRRYGVDVSPDQILVTAGTSPAMLLLFTALLERGDQVVLSDPHYACYPKFVKFADGEPVYVPVDEDDAFQFRPEAVSARLGPRTKAIVINSPANPTGTVLGPDRMAAIARLGPWIVSDEIYHGLTYEGPEHSVLEFTDRAFVLNGFSKAYAMTGWRVGYLIAPREFMAVLNAAHGNFFISSNEFVQWAALAALREAGDDAARFRRIFDERRHAMVAGLVRIGLGVGAPPTGAFYVLANARRYTADSLAFAFEILEHTHVAVTPGVDFGRNAEGYLRFCYANSLERIDEALTRIGAFLHRRAAERPPDEGRGPKRPNRRPDDPRPGRGDRPKARPTGARKRPNRPGRATGAPSVRRSRRRPPARRGGRAERASPWLRRDRRRPKAPRHRLARPPTPAAGRRRPRRSRTLPA